MNISEQYFKHSTRETIRYD